MNNTLNFTQEGTVGTVLVTDVLEYGDPWGFGDMAKVVTSRQEVVWAFLDELTIWGL